MPQCLRNEYQRNFIVFKGALIKKIIEASSKIANSTYFKTPQYFINKN